MSPLKPKISTTKTTDLPARAYSAPDTTSVGGGSRFQPNRNARLRSILEGRSRTVVSHRTAVAKRGQIAVSDRRRLGGLTQFDVSGSATGP